MRAIAVLLLVVGCGSANRAAGPPLAPWTWAEWLPAAEGYVAEPSTMPELGSREFARLVSPASWAKLDGAAFEKSGDQIIRFFPTMKGLMRISGARSNVDEFVALGVFMLEVYPAIIGAGAEFIARLPDDGSRQNRLHGLETVRLGAAIEVCGLLYVATGVSREVRSAVLAKLSDPASYGVHSREGLQLITATLDERLLPAVGAKLEQPYRTIREAVAREYAKRSEPVSSTRTTYEGMSTPTQAGRVVSTTGRFSVAIGPTALAKRVETKQANGTASVSHWIELQDGNTKLESACFDDKSEAEIAAGLLGVPGVAARESAQPGTWLALGGRWRPSQTRSGAYQSVSPRTFHARAGGMKIRPLHDRVLAKRIPEVGKTTGGLFIPDNAKEKPLEATVIAVGSGKRLDDGKIQPLTVKAGDRILIGKYSGSEVKLDGADHIILGEDDVLAIFDES